MTKDELICSRAQCGAKANWNVNWRNPRIHGPERVKVWLGCDDHVDFLADYLRSRSFPVKVTRIGVSVNRVEETE